MSKHTPGPWEIESSDGEVIYGTDRHGERLVVVYEMNTNAADRQLILAAPLMLETLHGVLRAANVPGSDWSAVLDTVRDTIAKATR